MWKTRNTKELGYYVNLTYHLEHTYVGTNVSSWALSKRFNTARQCNI
jgi:hypothetical protein